MARANLNFSKEINDVFLAANSEDSRIRILKVSISEESLIVNTTIECQGSTEDDFETLLPSTLSDDEAAFALFRVFDLNISPGYWILVAWVPDFCRVRDKMLYSSSREDLKRNLGIGYFKAEYATNTKDDLKWITLQAHLDKDSKVLYSTKEIMLQEEKSLAHSESNTTKSVAMSVLPIGFPEESKSTFSRFHSNEINFVEITIENETIVIKNSLQLPMGEKLNSHLNHDDARFYLTNVQYNNTVFVYYCPEITSIKNKMTMSSSKATVLSILKSIGIEIAKNVEIRESGEIDDIIKSDSESVTTTGSAAANITYSKPVRPGRGKAKITKFQADE